MLFLILIYEMRMVWDINKLITCLFYTAFMKNQDNNFLLKLYKHRRSLYIYLELALESRNAYVITKSSELQRKRNTFVSPLKFLVVPRAIWLPSTFILFSQHSSNDRPSKIYSLNSDALCLFINLFAQRIQLFYLDQNNEHTK